MPLEPHNEEYLSAFMAAKSDTELQEYLINIKEFSGMEVKTAFDELQRRGWPYTLVQLEYLQQVIKQKMAEEDPNVPAYYSREAIFIFSVLGTPVMGAILMAINLKERHAKLSAMAYGTLGTIMVFVISSLVLGMPFSIFILNATIGLMLTLLLWKKYMSTTVVYKRKNILIPLSIAFAIAAIIFFFFIVSFLIGEPTNWQRPKWMK